jgi:hypothetical protein
VIELAVDQGVKGSEAYRHEQDAMELGHRGVKRAGEAYFLLRICSKFPEKSSGMMVWR